MQRMQLSRDDIGTRVRNLADAPESHRADVER
jgi:hypothetical protein